MPNPTHENPRSFPTADLVPTSGTRSINELIDGPNHSPIMPVSPPGYELLEEIGRGGMGVVYRAEDTTFGREVAIKVLEERFTHDPAAAHRFAHESRITGQLQHPGIPAVHDLGTLADGRPFLAMKLINGDTLEQLLKTRPAPSVDRERFVAIFEQVCQAVAYAHAHKIIHRDLKPANVMVGAFGEVQGHGLGARKATRRGAR